MNYIELLLQDGTTVYQESDASGMVTRYLDASGAYLYDQVPLGIGTERIVNVTPPHQAWMI